jgi:putative inorganic carbon (hco3(-)) transporter
VQEKIQRKMGGGKSYERVAIVILLAGSLLISVLHAQLGIYVSLLVMALWGLPIVYSIVVYPKFGIGALVVVAYMLFLISRQGIAIPWGTMLDGIQALLILGFFIRQKTKPDWTILNGGISIWLGIWVLYNLLQVINPVAESRLAWLFTVRTTAIVTLMYYVFVYHIRTIAYIRFLLKLWLGLALFGALYAFKQEYIGFSTGEQAWLDASPGLSSLLFIDGVWRKFSIFSDPVAFSYNMVIASLLCVGLLSVAKGFWKKLLLLTLAIVYIFAMLLSGTRGAYVLIPAGLVLYIVMNLNVYTITLGTLLGGIFLVLIYIPTSNYTLYRFQTAFKPSDDASFNVRAMNQKRIQPYIQSHPFGGGLGATGTWGLRFSPDSYLASFPPDSGYVRVAVELGWGGLLIFCMLMFTILKTGVINYYKIRNPELKAYCLSMTLVIFALNVGNYPQEALVQYPSNVLFYLSIALITITYKLDQEWQSPT